MNRRRKILLALVIPTLAVVAWQWLIPHPYKANPEPAALAEVRYVQLTRDHSFHWLNVRLDITDPARHDLSKGLSLVLDDGRELTPAGLELEGSGEVSATESGPAMATTVGMTVKFWLEPKDFAGPIRLKINDGSLIIREESGTPKVDDTRILKNSKW